MRLHVFPRANAKAVQSFITLSRRLDSTRENQRARYRQCSCLCNFLDVELLVVGLDLIHYYWIVFLRRGGMTVAFTPPRGVVVCTNVLNRGLLLLLTTTTPDYYYLLPLLLLLLLLLLVLLLPQLL